MTVSAQYSPPAYLGNGATTAFAFPYQFFAAGDIQVQLYDTAAQNNVNPQPILNGGGTYDYTVTGAQDAATGEYLAGGTITFNTAPPGNYQITLIRNVAGTQPASLTNNSPFPAKTIESVLDRLTLYAQGLKATFARAVQFPFGDPIGSVTLAPPAIRANTILAFNAIGEFVYSAAVSVSQAQAILTQALAAATAATSLTYGGLSLVLAVAQIGSAQATYPVVTTQNVTSNFTVPKNVTLDCSPGGTINIAGGVNLIINGPVIGQQKAMFTGAGTVSFGTNPVQTEYFSEWFNIPTDLITDAAPAVNAMIAAVPDNAHIIVATKSTGSTGWLLNSTVTLLNRVGVHLTTPNPSEEKYTGYVKWGGATGGTIFKLDGCGYCEVSGFGADCLTADRFISFVHSGSATRIDTGNIVRYNFAVNNNLRATWKACAIGDDGSSNGEFFTIEHNFFHGNTTLNGFGAAAGCAGIGIDLGENSNNHIHYCHHNSCVGCLYGVAALWFSSTFVHHNSNSNQTDFAVGHVAAPVVIINPDSELSGQFLTTSGEMESTITVLGGRLAGMGQNAAGKGFFQFGGLDIAAVSVIGTDFQNWAQSPATCAIFDITAAGQHRIVLQGLGLANWGGQHTANQTVFMNLTSANAGRIDYDTWRLQPNRFSHTSSAYTPTANATAAELMMGLAAGANPWLLTPVTTGSVRIRVCGYTLNTTAGASAVLRFRYGTGAAPANGAASTGTQINSQAMTLVSQSANAQMPFTFESEITALTLGTQYWFDPSLAAPTNTASVVIMSVIIVEY